MLLSLSVSEAAESVDTEAESKERASRDRPVIKGVCISGRVSWRRASDGNLAHQARVNACYQGAHMGV